MTRKLERITKQMKLSWLKAAAFGWASNLLSKGTHRFHTGQAEVATLTLERAFATLENSGMTAAQIEAVRLVFKSSVSVAYSSGVIDGRRWERDGGDSADGLEFKASERLKV